MSRPVLEAAESFFAAPTIPRDFEIKLHRRAVEDLLRKINWRAIRRLYPELSELVSSIQAQSRVLQQSGTWEDNIAHAPAGPCTTAVSIDHVGHRCPETTTVLPRQPLNWTFRYNPAMPVLTSRPLVHPYMLRPRMASLRFSNSYFGLRTLPYTQLARPPYLPRG
eukprot:Gregarina_sp_Poly_1__636@NODE_114_length_13862_cov_162_782240_g101_i0_p9_GENE_NODE_114_length_13862_cov_162_782240_g101_i0NODE_114_length_13862_cov_162_782240_g101_i0_p9_ORF_typecomplete_len165_score12_39_NODE_114_length_13862_cov_162_782240_g101_i086789172